MPAQFFDGQRLAEIEIGHENRWPTQWIAHDLAFVREREPVDLEPSYRGTIRTEPMSARQ